MPVVLPDSTLWEATGHATSTTFVVVTHPDVGGTTAGSTVIVVLRSAGASSFTAPAGWERDLALGVPGITAYRLDNAAAAQTSWTFTRGPSAGNTAWYMRESDHLSFDELFEVASTPTSGTNATGTTRSTGTTALNAGSQVVAIAVFASTKAASGDTHSWGSYTNSFTERVDFNPAGVAGQCIAVADRVYDGQSTFECTGTFTTSTGSPSTGAVMLIYRAHDASINAPLAWFTGFAFGTHAGLANGTSAALGSGASLSGTPTYGTHYSVTAGAAKGSGYGLEIANSASAHAIISPALPYGSFSFSGAVDPVSGSGTPVAMVFSFSGSADMQLMYDVTNEKFGLQWIGGSTVWQTGASPVGSYPFIQIRGKGTGSTYHADWWIETGTGDGFQTSPTDPTGASLSTTITLYFGPGTGSTQTATFHYAHPVLSRFYAAHPLSPHSVTMLVPETTGATVSGTAANFQRVTNNGTLAAVSGTEGALVDEFPPTVSASSDAVVQVNNAASDYIQFPMTTRVLAPDEIIAGVRMVAALWSGTGSGSGDLAIRGHDGLTETALATASQILPGSTTTASATYPLWRSAMWSGASSGAWTPTRLAAAVLRMGFSADATPDMGVSAIGLEVATRVAPTARTLTVGADEMTADLVVNPYNSATVSYIVTNNAPARTATFAYSLAGVPQTPVTVAPGASTTVDIHADAFGDVSDLTLGE